MNESSSLYDPRTAPEDAGQDERLIDRFPVRLFEGSCQHALSIIHLNQRYMAQLVSGQQGEAAGELRQSLEDIQTAAARLDRDVTQMLCLLRCLQHSEKPRWELIDLCAFVQDLCLPRKMLSEALGVRLSLSCAGVRELYVQADRQYLTYICLALLSNALRACTPGGGKVTIALRQGDDGTWGVVNAVGDVIISLEGTPYGLLRTADTLLIPENRDGGWDVVSYVIGGHLSGVTYVVGPDGNPVGGSGDVTSAELDGTTLRVTDSTGSTTDVALA